MIYLLIYFIIGNCAGLKNHSLISTVSETVEISIQDSLILYNVITPNGDGDNDFLMFDDLDKYDERAIMVTDQWGQKVYESNNYNNDWDGSKNGKPLPSGMYRYYLRLDGKTLSSNLSIIYN